LKGKPKNKNENQKKEMITNRADKATKTSRKRTLVEEIEGSRQRNQGSKQQSETVVILRHIRHTPMEHI